MPSRLACVTALLRLLVLGFFCLCCPSLPLRCSASYAEFLKLDATSPSFDVDLGQSAEQRWTRLQRFASTPLKGWNSYDGWDWSVTERDVVGNVDYMAANLSSLGYVIATIDYYWYMDLDAQTLYLDPYGRVQPDPNRFPSSNGNAGYKKLAAYAHSKGLLFGIHTMRGISAAAVTQKLPVFGTNYTADEVYDATAQCPWHAGGDAANFYSLNMSHPGGQLFYNALFQQYADWGVDFVKNDCVFANYVPDQVFAVSAAMEASGRQMLYSLSPGDDNADWAIAIASQVNMYRITGDTWDRWDNIASHWGSAQRMQPFIGRAGGRYGLPSWPDLDMLPLGWLGVEGSNTAPNRPCALTADEQQSLMSLWTIFRSPLMYGGDLQHQDAASQALITNPEALRITDHSLNNNYTVSTAGQAVWRADSEHWQQDGVSYFTVHNLEDGEQNITVSASSVRGHQAGSSNCVLRDVWQRDDVGSGSSFTFTLRKHASGLYALHDCKSDGHKHAVIA